MGHSLPAEEGVKLAAPPNKLEDSSKAMFAAE
jgi:hypothetical protein